MKAGKTQYEVGTRVEICNQKSEDAYFNGKCGELTHVFPGTGLGKGVAGVRLDSGEVMNIFKESEIKILEPRALIVFRLKDKIIHQMTVEGYFAGEIAATGELLCKEHNCTKKDIMVSAENCGE